MSNDAYYYHLDPIQGSSSDGRKQVQINGGITNVTEREGGCDLAHSSRTHCTPSQVSGGTEYDVPFLSLNFCKVSTIVTVGPQPAPLSPLKVEPLWLVWLRHSSVAG